MLAKKVFTTTRWGREPADQDVEVTIQDDCFNAESPSDVKVSWFNDRTCRRVEFCYGSMPTDDEIARIVREADNADCCARKDG